jgi:8-amino-7-oxononanoate synthase
MGTFSKAFGCYGGFVAGSSALIEYLRHFARSIMFSASLSPMTIGAVRGALEVMRDDPSLLAAVTGNANFMKTELAGVGFDVGQSHTPIVPVMIRDGERCRKLVAEAHEQGLFLSNVEYPAVPLGSERIRLTVAADHSRADLEQAVEILSIGGRRHGVL